MTCGPSKWDPFAAALARRKQQERAYLTEVDKALELILNSIVKAGPMPSDLFMLITGMTSSPGRVSLRLTKDEHDIEVLTENEDWRIITPQEVMPLALPSATRLEVDDHGILSGLREVPFGARDAEPLKAWPRVDQAEEGLTHDGPLGKSSSEILSDLLGRNLHRH